ncbi:MAG: hypothetical protein LBQ50_02545 [Planctomycetaceae bacterium]|nr:hypothetical protein [Planctomycetaceae bacterium]
MTILIAGSGCGQRLPPPPEGLPVLYPCIVSVTFGGEMIEGVNVGLKSVDSNFKWQSGGKTNANGIATLKTSFAYDGVPEGKFVISFTKLEERDGVTVATMAPYSVIPLKYGQKQSKEVIEILPQKNEFTFTLDGGGEVTK